MNTAQEKAQSLLNREAGRVEQMLRELASDLADQVALGDLTEEQANQWLSNKQDQWMMGTFR